MTTSGEPEKTEQEATGSENSGWNYETEFVAHRQHVLTKIEIRPCLSSWLRVIEHFKRGNVDTAWAFVPQDEPRDEVQNYFHQLWIDDLSMKGKIEEIAKDIFHYPQAAQMNAVAASIQAANEARRQKLAAERGVKTSSRNVIRRAHKPQEQPGVPPPQ